MIVVPHLRKGRFCEAHRMRRRNVDISARPGASGQRTAELRVKPMSNVNAKRNSATVSEARNPPGLMVRSAALCSASRTMQGGRVAPSFETPTQVGKTDLGGLLRTRPE